MSPSPRGRRVKDAAPYTGAHCFVPRHCEEGRKPDAAIRLSVQRETDSHGPSGASELRGEVQIMASPWGEAVEQSETDEGATMNQRGG